MNLANCPKCGRHLRIIDWKQHCPDCGVNIFVYNQQERLMQEADIAEVQYYHFQKKIDRVKASFIGTKLAIVRIFTSLLPVGAVFLPLVKAKFAEPFEAYDGGLSILDIVNKINGLTGDGIPTMLSGESKTAGIIFAASILMFVLSALATLLHFILNTLSCSPKGKQRNFALDGIILVTSVAAALLFLFMPENAYVNGTLGIGAYLYLLLQVVNVVIDVITLKKGIPVNHKQCYVGGIPIEEYFEMQEKGMTTEEIRVIQYERLQIIQDELEAKLKEEEEKAKKAEKAKQEAIINGR